MPAAELGGAPERQTARRDGTVVAPLVAVVMDTWNGRRVAGDREKLRVDRAPPSSKPGRTNAITNGKRARTAASSSSRILTACAGTPSAVARPASIITVHARRESARPSSATFDDPLKSDCA